MTHREAFVAAVQRLASAPNPTETPELDARVLLSWATGLSHAGLLARWPRALILDEPLAGLDAASQRGLLRLLTDLRLNTGLTVIVISHDFAGLEELCPRTLHLDRGVLGPAGAMP